MKAIIRRFFVSLIINPLRLLLQLIARGILTATGWSTTKETINQFHVQKKAVLIALHSTYWDAVIAVMFQLAYRLPMVYAINNTYTRLPIIGTLLTWLGFIHVGAGSVRGDTSRLISALNDRERYLFVIMPEGQIVKGSKWYSGYYHIARVCEVNIIPMELNFANHTLCVDGLDPVSVKNRSIEDVQQECQRRLCSSAIPLHLGNTYPPADVCSTNPAVKTSLIKWHSFGYAIVLGGLFIFILLLFPFFVIAWFIYRQFSNNPLLRMEDMNANEIAL